jgi:hypothetical protein
MAVLTNAELETVRRQAARRAPATWTKAQINAALQAIEDAVQSTSNVGARSLKTYLGNAIEAAAPGVFGAAAKDELFSLWQVLNIRRGGLI